VIITSTDLRKRTMNAKEAAAAQRKSALRTALILASVAAVFFFGIILKQALLAH
jgi:hypothetical protein